MQGAVVGGPYGKGAVVGALGMQGAVMGGPYGKGAGATNDAIGMGGMGGTGGGGMGGMGSGGGAAAWSRCM